MGCDGTYGRKWDLNSPIYINNQISMPNSDVLVTAMNAVITNDSHGIVSKTYTQQTITLSNTSDSDCALKSMPTGFAHTPTVGVINICDSFIKLLTTANRDDAIESARRTLIHEWGHEMSNRDCHTPCPLKDKNGKIIDKSQETIMSPAANCEPDIKTYTKTDLLYFCCTGYTKGGVCDDPTIICEDIKCM